jgi:tetratricopeptide (TPR) repeat protein
MAIKFDPAKADIYADRGKCFQKMGRLEEALDDFNEAIFIQNQNDKASFFYSRGVVYGKMDRHDEAI